MLKHWACSVLWQHNTHWPEAAKWVQSILPLATQSTIMNNILFPIGVNILSLYNNCMIINRKWGYYGNVERYFLTRFFLL